MLLSVCVSLRAVDFSLSNRFLLNGTIITSGFYPPMLGEGEQQVEEELEEKKRDIIQPSNSDRKRYVGGERERVSDILLAAFCFCCSYIISREVFRYQSKQAYHSV